MRSCQNCDAAVSPRFVQMFESRDGVVYACGNCTTYAAVKRGAAATPELDRRVDE